MLYLMVGIIVIASTAFAEWRGMGTTSVTEVKDVPPCPQQSGFVSAALHLFRPYRRENDMNAIANMVQLVAALVYALLGIVLFVVSFIVFDKLTPGSIWKELFEDQNTALGNLMAGVAIALAIIIAAAIH
jgi:hypothetical protein